MSQINTEEEAFLDDILHNPYDDHVRLIYSDWLEDQNTAESKFKCNFIRAGILISYPAPDKDRSGRCVKCELDDFKLCTWHYAEMYMHRIEQGLDPIAKLRMWDSIKWTGSLAADEITIKWNRGFAEGVCMPLAHFLYQGDLLVSRHPITRYKAKLRSFNFIPNVSQWVAVKEHKGYRPLAWNEVPEDVLALTRSLFRTVSVPDVGTFFMTQLEEHIFLRVMENVVLNKIRKRLGLSELILDVNDDWKDMPKKQAPELT